MEISVNNSFKSQHSFQKPSNPTALNSKESFKGPDLAVLRLGCRRGLQSSTACFWWSRANFSLVLMDGDLPPAQRDEEPPHQSCLKHGVQNRPVQQHHGGPSFFLFSVTISVVQNIWKPKWASCSVHRDTSPLVFTSIYHKHGALGKSLLIKCSNTLFLSIISQVYWWSIAQVWFQNDNKVLNTWMVDCSIVF